MAWKLQGRTIPAPSKKEVKLDIQQSTHRTLDGGYSRDYIGSEKKVFICEWENILKTDFDWIYQQYSEQRDAGTAKNLTIDELSFNANVIIDMTNYSLEIPNHYNWRSLAVTFIEV